MGALAEPDASARPDVEIRLLGPFSVTVAGRTVDPRAWRLTKAQHIVKLLALAPRHRVHRDELLELLWADRDPRSAANNLYQALSAARRAITSAGGDGHACLCLGDEWVSLAPSAGLWVDVEEFEARSTSEDLEDVREALLLYRGELLADDRYAEWLIDRRAALARTHHDLLHRLAAHCVESGDTTQARRLLRQLLDEDPVNENAHQALMRVHALDGDRAAAQEQYTALESALREHLGVEPSPRSRHVHEEIRSGALAPPDLVPAQTRAQEPPPQDVANNLPTALSSFVGRRRELTELQRAVSRHRLVTLTGPGGCGKTRLASEVAARSFEGFPDGVFLVELGPLTPGSRVDLQVARTLGVRGSRDQAVLEAVADRIGAARMLLVVDNCEHVVDASADLVETLLSACPRLAVLATSREPLRVPGERVRRVPSLQLPDVRNLPSADGVTRYEAVRLLVDRVAAGEPDFELDESSAASAAQICVRLDGLPLAVELAAALVPTLGLTAVADGLDDRFHLLTTGHRTGLTRHQTLRAAIAWSFDLLADEQRHLLCRLAAFRDSFDVPAALAVAGVADSQHARMAARLADLADRSMIVAEPELEPPRFHLLETIREYGVDELRRAGALDEALDAHARWMASFVGTAVAELSGPQHHLCFARFDRSRADLEAALARLRVIDPAEALRLLAAMWRYWLWFGYLDEGIHEVEAALAAGDVPSEARSECWLALFALHSRWIGVQTPQRHRHIDHALAEARAVGSARAESRALVFDGLYRELVDLDPFETAGERFLRAAQAASSAGLHGDRASALLAHAALAAQCSRNDVARHYLHEARRSVGPPSPDAGVVLMLPVCPVTTSRRLGVPWVIWEDTLFPLLTTSGRSAEAYLEANLGSLERAVGHGGAARRHLAAALAMYRDEGNASGEALVLARLGSLALGEDDLERAGRRMEAALALYDRVGDVRGRHMVMLGLSRVAIERGATAVARALLDDVRRAAREQGDQPALWCALHVRGALEVAVGDLAAAIEVLREARRMQTLVGHPLTIAVVTLDLADAYRRAGRSEDALEPAAAAHRIFAKLGYGDAAATCAGIRAGAGGAAGPRR